MTQQEKELIMKELTSIIEKLANTVPLIEELQNIDATMDELVKFVADLKQENESLKLKLIESYNKNIDLLTEINKLKSNK